MTTPKSTRQRARERAETDMDRSEVERRIAERCADAAHIPPHAVFEFWAHFETCVHATWGNAEFMSNWRRLRGSRLGLDDRSPLDRMIDSATGAPGLGLANTEEVDAFFAFVRDYIAVPTFQPRAPSGTPDKT